MVVRAKLLAGAALLLALAVLCYLAAGGPAGITPSEQATAAAPQPAATNGAAPVPAASAAQRPEPTAAGRTTLAVRAAFAVHGRAVRGPDQPVPGARVRARGFRGTAATGEPFVDAVLVADGAGEFEWPLEPPATLTFLELRGDGADVRSYPETFLLTPGDAPPDPFDLWILPLDGVVRGRVVDQGGLPIATARVGNDAESAVPVDGDGRFELRATRGDARLVATASGFVTARATVPVDPASGVGEVELRLRAAVRIHGTVRDEHGQPIAGAEVKTFYTIFEPAVRTAADGRFALDNLDPGQQSHSLFARHEGYLEGKAEVVTKGPDTEQDLVLKRGVAVRGVVVDSQTGAPVAAATVFVGDSPNSYDRLDAVTGLDGSFAFDCVAPGSRKVNVERRGFAAARQAVDVPAAPAPAVELRLPLERGHFVGGTLVDGDGKPVPRVSIAPRLLGEYVDGIRGRTDGSGRFRLDGVPKGDLALEFYGGGIVRHVEPVPVVDRDDLRVVAQRHGYVAGTVVDGGTAAPIERFRIRFGTPTDGSQPRASGYSASWHRGGKEFSDAAGTFRIDEELKIGSVLALEASADGYGPTVVDPVTVTAAADPAQLVLRLWPAATIAGVVRDAATNAPIEGARLIAWLPGRPRSPYEPNDDDGRPLATSAADGSFTLAGVGQGDVRIHVAREGWLAQEHGPIAVAAGQPVPPQVVLLAAGVTLTLAVESAGAPVAGAEVTLYGASPAGGSAPTGTTDARGEVRLPNLGPGRYSAMVRRDVGGRQSARTWIVVVERTDRRCVLSLGAGDASLQIVVESDEPLPADLSAQIVRGHQQQDGAFVSATVPLEGGRALARELPAGELAVMVFSPSAGGAAGSCKVTAPSGAVTEARVRLVNVQNRR